MMEPQEVEPFGTLGHSNDPRLPWMQLQVQALQHQPDSPHAFQRVSFASAHEDKVVGVPHQHTKVATSVLPHAIEFVQDDVGQERRGYASGNVAKRLPEFSITIPRSRLRPAYGD